jgi:type IV pilus assembly protein PilB
MTELTEKWAKELGVEPNGKNTVFEPRQCTRCFGVGYKGRFAVLESLIINDDLRDAIEHGRSTQELKRIAKEGGFKTMLQRGAQQAMLGTTSIHELQSELSDAM